MYQKLSNDYCSMKPGDLIAFMLIEEISSSMVIFRTV